MHITTPPGNFDADGEFPVYLNTQGQRGPFGVIDFGPGTYAHIEPEYAERMIRALAKIIAYDREYRQIHAFEPGEGTGNCARCGTHKRTPAHADPRCETCGATGDLEKTLWRSAGDGTERARYFCNDRRACNDRRFPEMAALIDGTEAAAGR